MSPASAHLARDLARLTRRSIEEATLVYERQVAALESDAKVKKFVSIIAWRRAREWLEGH